MKTKAFAWKALAGVAAGALALGAAACAGCAATSTLYEAGTHTYHELDTDWGLAYGWYEADAPEGFTVNDNGTIYSTTADRLYTFDNPGSPNTSDYQAIQVRLERGYIDDTEVKTSATSTAWTNDPAYENAAPFIEAKTTYKVTGEKELGGRTWTVMEAEPAVDSSTAAERKEPADSAKSSCKYLTQLDDKAYAVVDGYQIAADDDLIEDFLGSMKTVDSDFYDIFQEWSFENSVSKKSPAGMW